MQIGLMVADLVISPREKYSRMFRRNR